MDLSQHYRITSLASLYQMLRFVAPLFAERTALSDDLGTCRYDQLLADVQRLAANLATRGVSRCTRVALYGPKSVLQLKLILACNALGAAFVPINPQLKSAQVAHVLDDCRPTLLLSSAHRLAQLEKEQPQIATVRMTFEQLDAPAEVDGIVLDSLGQAIDGDPAVILYTSGSTGMPKGIVLTQRNLVAGALSVAEYLKLRPDDVVLGVLPISFDAGLSQFTTALVSGACYVPHEFVTAAQLRRSCARHGATVITAVPPLWLLVADGDWQEAGRSVRLIANTGGHMPLDLLCRLRAAFAGATPYLMYGLTESFRSTFLDPDQLDVRPDSMGRAVPNAEVRVVRADGSECEIDEPGELVHRGAFVTLGYLNQPERSAERFKPWPVARDGLVRDELAVWSGDQVRRDAQGYLYFLGRNDDLIKTSGHRVSPDEIEAVLHGDERIACAAVVGLPDPRLGQQIVACVVARTPVGADSVIAHCKKHLPGYMLPRHVWQFDALPLNANGKIDRPRLKAECLQHLEVLELDSAAQRGPELADVR